MDKTRRLLSDIVVHTKYARFKDGRRETWEEIVARTFEMHRQLILPNGNPISESKSLMHKLEMAEEMVLHKLVMPSMRSLQFSGEPILAKHERMYNCSYLPIRTFEDIKDLFTLCMVGCGVGFSLFSNIGVSRLSGPEDIHVIEDSVEGWCMSVYLLLAAYRGGKRYKFDYSGIRPEGTLIKSIGSFAPGGHVLEKAHALITEIVERALDGNVIARLHTIDLFDICCILGDTATCGGTRRSALITFFDHNDDRMLNAKQGAFWETKPYRSRANISATFNRNESGFKDKLHEFYLQYLGSETGEPGVFITNEHGWFSNPCAEISLQPYSFCNLTSINAAECLKDSTLFTKACFIATFIGTIQSLYTDFKLVSPKFRENAIKERLLGVSMTGLAAHDLKEKAGLIAKGAWTCNAWNAYLADELKIERAHRITCIKPEGSTSAVMGTSSGVHAEESEYYVRNVRVSKGRGLVKYLESIGYPFMETDVYNNSDMVIGIPMQAIGKTNEDKDVFELIDDIAILNENWIEIGHNQGANMHNVSTTLRIRPEEVCAVADRLIEVVDNYTAVAYLPASDVVYPQAPFQQIDKNTYDQVKDTLPDVDLGMVFEVFTGNEFDSACSGDKCELKR